MIAQLVPWKNHLAFIEAAARLASALPDARFVIAGDDLFGEHPAYRAELEARIARLGTPDRPCAVSSSWRRAARPAPSHCLDTKAAAEPSAATPNLKNRIFFAGYQPDIGPLLATCDVLIHPATREPLGRVILEAMAAGKPVVAVNAGGPAEIIRHEQDGLLTASDAPDELAAAALRLIRDPALAERLGAAARQRVRADFDIRRTVLEVEALYTRLLTQTPPATQCGAGLTSGRKTPG
jgi:glycosyltransferase involved in cell wall biosynthesis